MLRPIFTSLPYQASSNLPNFMIKRSRVFSFFAHFATALTPASRIIPHIKYKKYQHSDYDHRKKMNYTFGLLFTILIASGSNQIKKLQKESDKVCEQSEQSRIKSLIEGLSPFSLKRVAPFLKDINSAYMVHYIDNMEALLELAPPTQEESEMLYERALDSIYVHTQSDEFRSWVQELFLKLSKSALGKMVLEKWMAQCNCNEPHLRAMVIDERRRILPLPARAIAPNEIGLHYQFEGIYFSSVVSGIWKMPAHIILAHEMLHCIRWKEREINRIGLKAIERRLSNAEEEYTILGIEKRLYT